ncbi:MAG: 2-C-methyl-D-erythritol 4-phosphate cytidylyltransferase, partial [Tannerellaceae bacterium]
AAVPAIPLTDSLRYIEAEGSHPVDRSRYLAVQTPQVFCSDLLLRAYRQSYSPLFTADASVVEAIGQPVTLVPGNPENIKITTPFDLKVAEILFSHYA